MPYRDWMKKEPFKCRVCKLNCQTAKRFHVHNKYTHASVVFTGRGKEQVVHLQCGSGTHDHFTEEARMLCQGKYEEWLAAR